MGPAERSIPFSGQSMTHLMHCAARSCHHAQPFRPAVFSDAILPPQHIIQGGHIVFVSRQWTERQRSTTHVASPFAAVASAGIVKIAPLVIVPIMSLKAAHVHCEIDPPITSVHRFCAYPQELVLALHTPARLAQLQLLVHESKIASQIELYAGFPSPGMADLSRSVGSFTARFAAFHMEMSCESVLPEPSEHAIMTRVETLPPSSLHLRMPCRAASPRSPPETSQSDVKLLPCTSKR